MPPNPSKAWLPAAIVLTGLLSLGFLVMSWPAGIGVTHIAALLIFLVGLAFAGFLWWLAHRSFAMLTDPATTPEQIAALRELPMALPEGTVRAVLALIVGVVGLPLLLFAATLGLTDAVAGYVNGIIAGVFGYYFGARAQMPDAQAQRRVTEALTTEQRVNEDLRRTAATAAETAAEAALRPLREDDAHGRLVRHVAVAELLVERLGPALPAGILPAEAPAMLRRARETLSAFRPGGDLSGLLSATTALTGAAGPFAALLRAAAPLLPGIAGGPLAGVALLVSLGWQASTGAWRRWQASVLDAPHDPALFDAGAITPGEALDRLAQAPIFAACLEPLRTMPGFAAELADMALRDDGAARIWSAWGRHFAAPAQVEEGLAEYRRALLAGEAADDITEDRLRAATTRLAQAAPALRPEGTELPAARALLSRRAGTVEQHAALEALGLLVGTLRDTHQDPIALITEIQP